jgi:hypothetical protein
MEVTREIQSGFYGYPVNNVATHARGNREAFVYPVYIVFLLAPTVEIPFSMVQRVFRWFLLACIGASVPLWMGAVGFCRERRISCREPCIMNKSLPSQTSSSRLVLQ